MSIHLPVRRFEIVQALTYQSNYTIACPVGHICFVLMFSLSAITCVIGAVLVAVNAAQANVNASAALGPYKVSSITVSGVSSGAYMAVQMHVSYSMLISGIAAFAGVS